MIRETKDNYTVLACIKLLKDNGIDPSISVLLEQLLSHDSASSVPAEGEIVQCRYCQKIHKPHDTVSFSKTDPRLCKECENTMKWRVALKVAEKRAKVPRTCPYCGKSNEETTFKGSHKVCEKCRAMSKKVRDEVYGTGKATTLQGGEDVPLF